PPDAAPARRHRRARDGSPARESSWSRTLSAPFARCQIAGQDLLPVVTLTAVEFGILGPLEVRDDGRLLPLRQGRPLSLLTALLLRLGEGGSWDAPVEGGW